MPPELYGSRDTSNVNLLNYLTQQHILTNGNMFQCLIVNNYVNFAYKSGKIDPNFLANNGGTAFPIISKLAT